MRRLHQLQLFCRQLLTDMEVIAFEVPVALCIRIDCCTTCLFHIVAKQDRSHERYYSSNYRVLIGSDYLLPIRTIIVQCFCHFCDVGQSCIYLLSIQCKIVSDAVERLQYRHVVVLVSERAITFISCCYFVCYPCENGICCRDVPFVSIRTLYREECPTTQR